MGEEPTPFLERAATFQLLVSILVHLFFATGRLTCRTVLHCVSSIERICHQLLTKTMATSGIRMMRHTPLAQLPFKQPV